MEEWKTAYISTWEFIYYKMLYEDIWWHDPQQNNIYEIKLTFFMVSLYTYPNQKKCWVDPKGRRPNRRPKSQKTQRAQRLKRCPHGWVGIGLANEPDTLLWHMSAKKSLRDGYSPKPKEYSFSRVPPVSPCQGKNALDIQRQPRWVKAQSPWYLGLAQTGGGRQFPSQPPSIEWGWEGAACATCAPLSIYSPLVYPLPRISGSIVSCLAMEAGGATTI